MYQLFTKSGTRVDLAYLGMHRMLLRTEINIFSLNISVWDGLVLRVL